MNDNEYWTRFIRTGNIYDYLNYTVCTSEESFGNQSHEEGGSDDSTGYGDGHGSDGYARWRL